MTTNLIRIVAETKQKKLLNKNGIFSLDISNNFFLLGNPKVVWFVHKCFLYLKKIFLDYLTNVLYN